MKLLMLLLVALLSSCSLTVSSGTSPQPVVVEFRNRVPGESIYVPSPGRPTADELALEKIRQKLKFNRDDKGRIQLDYSE